MVAARRSAVPRGVGRRLSRGKCPVRCAGLDAAATWQTVGSIFQGETVFVTPPLPRLPHDKLHPPLSRRWRCGVDFSPAIHCTKRPPSASINSTSPPISGAISPHFVKLQRVATKNKTHRHAKSVRKSPSRMIPSNEKPGAVLIFDLMAEDNSPASWQNCGTLESVHGAKSSTLTLALWLP